MQFLQQLLTNLEDCFEEVVVSSDIIGGSSLFFLYFVFFTIVCYDVSIIFRRSSIGRDLYSHGKIRGCQAAS